MKNLRFEIEQILQNTSKIKEWDIPKDYFNWGKDPRHVVDNTEKMPVNPNLKKKSLKKKITGELKKLFFKLPPLVIFDSRYSDFEETYLLMGNESSKRLFAELVLMMIIGENKMRLSSFTKEYVRTYEDASEEILKSNDILKVYKWELRKVNINKPSISIFTTPVNLALHKTDRLYSYHSNDTSVVVEKGDIVIDAGVGWGDTTVYLAALAANENTGWSYAFDILEDGMNALAEQCKQNDKLTNITPVLRALSDKDNETVNITSPSPGAKVTNINTGKTIQTITIDTFFKKQGLKKVDFIKMDIEGAEVPAIKGASETIKTFKPKLAISVYHKWDDLVVIPKLIYSLRDDYKFYLDCTTGFGGEAILYCK
ncbi:FkbM family methyltransferase [uncultured Algoriphagus sp.]|uniref:FkbM family methyltransferase n=1 Tax=uncultured Algoriphagus sp. TaxID=417365 RepID=UPI002583C196|nr:FkbM family methyltransferase [uncultured Algoriphagus sp.]